MSFSLFLLGPPQLHLSLLSLLFTKLPNSLHYYQYHFETSGPLACRRCKKGGKKPTFLSKVFIVVSLEHSVSYKCLWTSAGYSAGFCTLLFSPHQQVH